MDPVSGHEFPVAELDDERGEIVLRFRRGWALEHPTALVPKLVVETNEQKASLLRIGKAIAADRLAEDGPYRAARDLLARRAPHVSGHASGADLRSAEQSAEEAARDLVTRLDRSYLAIQGPPGSGKTWTGARMILDLVAQGRKVGVTANSHKVIGKLLDDVAVAARSDPRFAEGRPRIGQKPGQDSEPTCGEARSLPKNADVRDALWTTARWTSSAAPPGSGRATSWRIAWTSSSSTRPASSRWPTRSRCQPPRRSLVLLGDPQQLDQPTQGTHPPGADRSALAHLLGDEATMPGHLGLFMERTWRLHPDICAFTSEVFYEGKLEPQDGNEKQGLSGVPPLDGTGVRFLAVDHVAERDDTDSPAEAEAVAEIVGRLLSSGATWTDHEGKSRAVRPEDILIVSPFNLHRRRIRAALEARG